MTQSTFSQTLSQLETTLDEYFGKKAPQMPQNIKEVLVKIAPYLVILGVLFAVPGILALLSMGTLFTAIAPFAGMSGAQLAGNIWLASILTIPVVILEAMAIPGLFNKTKIAWKYMYWAQLVSLVASIIQFNLVGFVIGGAIGLYILFQIKSEYK
ncbi:chromate transporter [Candidatus Woesebacteria bacterium]|nr:chromate transporter [Candidatus Woesebacteria bacterium]